METTTPRIIRLNVGGTRYMTTLSTLKTRGENFLTLMLENHFSGKIPALTDEKGYFFIDRDGRLFGDVLNFLRTGRIPRINFDALSIEFDYYQINPTSNITNFGFKAEIEMIRREKVADWIKEALDKNWPWIFAALKKEAATSDSCTILYQRIIEDASTRTGDELAAAIQRLYGFRTARQLDRIVIYFT